MADTAVDRTRFAFGKNWLRFSAALTEHQILEAEASLVALLGGCDLSGMSMVDVGCGSGLFSLAARRLGAVVTSFDVDPDCVACTTALRETYRPSDSGWSVHQGSILDGAFVHGLGRFDLVYAWGVLHHTGNLPLAIRAAASLTSDRGRLLLAIYRRTPLCWAWRLEKRFYASASPAVQWLIRRGYVVLFSVAQRLHGVSMRAYRDEYAANRRGMDFERDVHDWLGGYPYDSISPAELDELLACQGFQQQRAVLRPTAAWGIFGSGCDEFVYRRVKS